MEDAQAQLRKLMAKHPDLPVICLADSLDADEYGGAQFCQVESAHIESLLMVGKIKGDGPKLPLPMSLYYDEDDAVEDLADGLLARWISHARDYGMVMREELYPDRFLMMFCGYDYWTRIYTFDDMAHDLAERIVSTLPWKKYIVIVCE
jgi:hypothetical protein